MLKLRACVRVWSKSSTIIKGTVDPLSLLMETSRRVHDPLGSRASSCYSASGSDHDIEMHHHGPGDEDWDEGDTFISFTTTETKCEQLFEEGLMYKTKGELDGALECFLKCLEGMQECQYFAKLPQTLHILAEIYQSLQCYDKAVEFASAEKLFYEAVLIDATHSQMRETATTAGATPGEKKHRGKRRPFSKKPRDQSWRRGSNPAEYGDLMIKKADEYNHLAKLCADQKKYKLALDYCGKAAKIRKSVFGDSHPVTAETLDYLTVLYAEVGRAEYAAALERAQRTDSSGHLDGTRGDLLHLGKEQHPSLTSEGDSCLNASLQLPPVNHTSAEVSTTVATCSSTMELTIDDNHTSDQHYSSISKGPVAIDKEGTTTMTRLEGKEEATLCFDSTLKESEERPRLVGGRGCTESKEEVGSQHQLLQMSSLSSHCHHNKEPLVSEHSLHGQHQETKGIQDSKSDLSDTSKNVLDSHSSCVLEHSKTEITNDPLHNSSTLQPTNKEDIDGAVNGANRPTTAAITDVLSKAPACVYVPVPEQGIEHARCLPLWVLLLGAFVEMAILAYVFVTHR